MRQSIWRKGTHQTSRKGRLPRQNREYVDTCSCTWKASPQKPVTLPSIMNFVWTPFHWARKPPEAIRDPKQRPQHTEPTLTHHKDPNTPQHNDVCLKASSQNMQTTTGQQRPDPTLTHTRRIPNTHHDVCLAEIHRACTHPTMNQTAQTRNTPQHNVCLLSEPANHQRPAEPHTLPPVPSIMIQDLPKNSVEAGWGAHPHWQRQLQQKFGYVIKKRQPRCPSTCCSAGELPKSSVQTFGHKDGVSVEKA